MYGIGLTQYNPYHTSVKRPPATLSFDGVDDVVTIPKHIDINIGTSYPTGTVELRFKANDIITRGVLWEEGGSSNGVNIYVDNGLLYVGWWTSQIRYLSTPIQIDQQYHAAVRWDSVAGRVDGLLNGMQFRSNSISVTMPNHSDDIGIGGVRNFTKYHDGSTSITYINADIREVRRWSVYRSDTEIQDNMNVELTGLETGLVGYWKLDEGTGDKIRDFSTNKNHGTKIGATWTY